MPRRVIRQKWREYARTILVIKKIFRHKTKNKKTIRTCIFNAVHELVDRAKVIVSEDLTSPISGKKYRKDTNRRLSSWTKGVIAEALNTVSQRRGSSLHIVNASYTSQIDHRTGCFTGTRRGDLFYCENGDVYQADENAAKNVRARKLTTLRSVAGLTLNELNPSYLNGLTATGWDCSTKTPAQFSAESELPLCLRMIRNKGAAELLRNDQLENMTRGMESLNIDEIEQIGRILKQSLMPMLSAELIFDYWMIMVIILFRSN